MKQILLAIDGEVPSRPVFQYAADLCRQIRAELCILQFARKNRDKEGVATPASGPLKQLLETSGCPDTVKVDLSDGSLETDLSDYVAAHHDVVLTVFDPGRKRRQTGRAGARRFAGLKQKLDVPLVVVQPPGHH